MSDDQHEAEARSTAERLAAHPYIDRVEDVSFATDRRLYEVSFYSGMPEVFTSMDEITVLACWIGVSPGLWGRLIGFERARKYGFGDDCLTAVVEVER